jgi:iron(III) transport system ATP-binding protein
MPVLLEIENVEKSFGKNHVLSELSLSVCKGVNVLLSGASGSGKSTLLRLIAGLDVPDRGSIRIAGKLVSQHKKMLVAPADRGIAMVFQDLGLWANLTVRQNVLLGLASARLDRRQKQERTDAALELCQIASRAAERPFRLSAGEQQRVALARAIAVRPKLLLLDEPFTGLDLPLKDLLLKPILALWREYRATIILVSHYPPDAVPLGATVVGLENGRIAKPSCVDALVRA